MGERELITAIEKALRKRGDRIERWIGDDAAVVRARGCAVTSIDTVAEDVHFELSTHEPGDIGHKALATALSDLAAMGVAEAGEAYVGLALGRSLDADGALALVEAMEALAETHGATIAGGDVTAAPALVVTVAVTGWANDPAELAYRDGAAPGELVGVTGELGGSGAGRLALGAPELELRPAVADALARRHLRPEPRLAAGRALAQAGVSAMIDLSDGVATDAAHIAEQSQVGLRIALAELPLADGVAEVARATGRDPSEIAASAGDDYELLFTAGPESRDAIEAAARATGSEVTWIGGAFDGSGCELLREDGSAAALRGFEHGV